MKATIYKITLSSTGKIYIGQSKNIERRIATHYIDLCTHSHHNKDLQHDFDTLGGTLTVEILEEIVTNSEKQVWAKEHEWMVKEQSYKKTLVITTAIRLYGILRTINRQKVWFRKKRPTPRKER